MNRGSPRHAVSPGLRPEAATPADRLAQLAATMAGTLRHQGPTTTASGSTPPPASSRVPPAGDHRPVGRRLQPMRSPAGRYTMVFNGEIYNHGELRHALGPAVRLRGHSDTEVLLAAMDAGRGGRAGPSQRDVRVGGRRCPHRHAVPRADRIGEKPRTTAGPARPSCSVPSSRHCASIPTFRGPSTGAPLAPFLRYTFVPAPHDLPGRAQAVAGHDRDVHGRDAARPPPAARPYWRLSEVAARGPTRPVRSPATGGRRPRRSTTCCSTRPRCG